MNTLSLRNPIQFWVALRYRIFRPSKRTRALQKGLKRWDSRCKEKLPSKVRCPPPLRSMTSDGILLSWRPSKAIWNAMVCPVRGGGRDPTRIIFIEWCSAVSRAASYCLEWGSISREEAPDTSGPVQALAVYFPGDQLHHLLVDRQFEDCSLGGGESLAHLAEEELG